MQVRHCINTACLWGLLLCFACSTGQDAITKIDESPLGAVFLRRLAGGPKFQAAHPIKIDSSTITLILNGILVRDNPPAQKNSSESSNVRRLFSGSEVGHVAPLVSEGLRRATPDQEVEFRIGDVTGVLYAYGRSLYVTLTEDRSGLDAATTTAIANRMSDGKGFANRTLSFIPEAAQRGNSYRDARSTDTTLVIDYELLAMLPPASLPSASAQNAPTLPPQSGNADKADPVKRDAEIEALRKELQDIKKQLADQEAERARSQRTNPIPQK